MPYICAVLLSDKNTSTQETESSAELLSYLDKLRNVIVQELSMKRKLTILIDFFVTFRLHTH